MLRKLKRFPWRERLHDRHWLAGCFWIGLSVPSFIWWRESILLVLACSLYANIENSFAASEAKRAKDEQKKQNSPEAASSQSE